MLSPMTRTRRLGRGAVLLGIAAGAMPLASCDETQQPLSPLVTQASQLSANALVNTWATRAPMTLARAQAKSTSFNNFIFVVGGRTSNGAPRTNVDAYNITNNTWAQRAPLPAARTALNGATTINGSDLCHRGVQQFLSANQDVVRLQHREQHVDQEGRHARCGSCGAQFTTGGQLYVYVGCTGVAFEHRLLRYNPATNSWISRAAPPSQHASPAAAGVISNRLYLAGGAANTSPNQSLHVYNPGTNSWITRAPMPDVQSNSATGVINGILFAAGGSDQNGAIKTLRAYNPATNSWSTKLPMPTARYDAAGTTAGGRLWAMGGFNSAGSVIGKNEAYSP